MNIQPTYSGLPFSWNGKSKKTIQSDCRWLETMIRNAAPFSAGWTKVRIVQLAYPKPPRSRSEAASVLPTYAGLESEAAIVAALRSLCALEQYPGFRQAVNETLIVQTLNSWHQKQFARYSSCRYEIYEDRACANIFLLTSTASIARNVDRVLPPVQRFRPLFNVEELARLLGQRQVESLTLKTHSYGTPDIAFYRQFQTEVAALTRKDLFTEEPPLTPQQFYLGYQWPSEKPLVSSVLWSDWIEQRGTATKLLLTLGMLAGIGGTLLYVFLQLFGVPLLSLLSLLPGFQLLWDWIQFDPTARLAVQWYWIVPTLLMFWLMALQLLRLVTYSRDRVRANRYGIPDLAEFCWQLDQALSQTQEQLSAKAEKAQNQENNRTLPLNLIGHGLGGQILIDAVHRLSPQFDKNKLTDPANPTWGQYLQLNQLILVAPDISLECIRAERNNAVRSVFHGCQHIYLFSSDRDIVLRYVTLLSSWLSEPNPEEAGLQLGNVCLLRSQLEGKINHYHPVIRNLLRFQPLANPTAAYDLIDRINYLDCSQLATLNGIRISLNPLTALPIDAINTLLFLLGRLAVHTGYLEASAPSFELLKFLIANSNRPDTELQPEIQRLIAGTPIRFLPSRSGATPLSMGSDEGEPTQSQNNIHLKRE